MSMAVDAQNNVTDSNEPTVAEFFEMEPCKFDMVDLRDLIKRHIATSYADLTCLVDTLPGMSDKDRKITLLNYIVHNKKQFAKLYAIARWASNCDSIQGAQDLIVYLQAENTKFNACCDSMLGTFSSFQKARLGRFDVLSAVEIMETKTFGNLPESIRSRFLASEKISPREASFTLDLVTDAIASRVFKTEVIPHQFTGLKMENGKLFLKFPNEFNVTLSLLGLDEKLPWHLVSVEILVKGTGKYEDRESLQKLSAHQYSHLMEMAQQALLPAQLKTVSDEIVPQKDWPVSSCLKKGSGKTRTFFICYLFDYIHSFCLKLQLEIMLVQAHNLFTTRWKDQLKIEINHERTEVKLSYWNRKIPLVFGKSAPPKDSSENYQTLIIKKVSVPEAALAVEWVGHSVISLTSQLSIEEAKMINPFEKAFYVYPYAVDLEKLLMKVVRYHIKLILIRFMDLLLKDEIERIGMNIFLKKLTKEDFYIQDSKNENPSLLVKYTRTKALRIIIEPRSGCIGVFQYVKNSSELRIEELERKFNDQPNKINEALSTFRLAKMVDGIKVMGVYHGLQYFNRLSLTQSDMSTFGSDITRLLYLQLPGTLDAYLAVGHIKNNFSFWFIETKPAKYVYSLASSVSLDADLLNYYSGIDKNQHYDLIGTPNQGKSDDGDDILSVLMKLCWEYYISSNIKAQFKVCQINDFFQHPPSITHPCSRDSLPSCLRELDDGSDHLTGTSPSLKTHQLFTIPAEKLFPGHTQPPFIAGPIKIFSPVDNSSWIVFSCEIDELLFRNEDHITFANRWNIETQMKEFQGELKKVYTLTFGYSDFKTCVKEFFCDWMAFTSAAKFYLEALTLNLKSLGMTIKLFDLESVSLRYHEHFYFTIGWGNVSQNGSNSDAPLEKLFKILLFSNQPDNLRNPHLRIQPFLEDLLNGTKDIKHIVKIIRITLPLMICFDEYEKKMFRGVNIIPKNVFSYRLYFSQFHAIDVSIVGQNSVRIADAFINGDHSRLPPFPWRPQTKALTNAPTSQPGSMQIKPSPIPYFSLFTLKFPYLISKLTKSGPCPFQSTETGVEFPSPFLIFALRALDRIFATVNLFQTAVNRIQNGNGPLPDFNKEDHFSTQYETTFAAWSLKATDNMTKICLESKLNAQGLSANGSNSILTHDSLNILSEFFTSKINQDSQPSTNTFYSSYAASRCPPEILNDFVQSIKFFQALEHIQPGSEGPVRADWFLTAPQDDQLISLGVKAGSQAFTFNQSEMSLGALFLINRGGANIPLPLKYNFSTLSITTWTHLPGSLSPILPNKTLAAINSLTAKYHAQAPADPLKITGFLNFICGIPIPELKQLGLLPN